MKYGNRPKFRIKRIANSPVTLGVFIILCFILGKAVWNVHGKAVLMETKLIQAETELTKLEERKKVLAGKVEFLSTEEGVEAEMRTKYRAVREGEFVAVIVDDKDAVAAIAEVASTTDSGWWSRILQSVGIGR